MKQLWKGDCHDVPKPDTRHREGGGRIAGPPFTTRESPPHTHTCRRAPCV